LPCSVCLAVAFLFTVVAIGSLWQNSASATDDGFLQVMMATRGGAEPQILLLKESVVATDDVRRPEQVKGQVWELAAGERARRPGFATVEETISVRKRGLA
jgi:hypothetical protein